MSYRDRGDDSSATVYVGNLGEDASGEEIEEAFGQYGPLKKSVWVARQPPGFAFVTFENAQDAENSVKNLDGTRLCGVQIRVSMSRGRRGGRGGGGGGGGRGGGRGGGDRGNWRSRSPGQRGPYKARSRSPPRNTYSRDY